ncbi:MAG: hypothetical protein CL799_13580 [Chromatiales bacterium]|nr:hypothetical protein [Chromatiales bacterium]
MTQRVRYQALCPKPAYGYWPAWPHPAITARLYFGRFAHPFEIADRTLQIAIFQPLIKACIACICVFTAINDILIAFTGFGME